MTQETLSTACYSVVIVLALYVLFFSIFHIPRLLGFGKRGTVDERPRWLSELLENVEPLAEDEIPTDPEAGTTKVARTATFVVSIMLQRVTQRGMLCSLMHTSLTEVKGLERHRLWLSRSEWYHIINEKYNNTRD